jgi:hypothetical protein
VFVARPEIAGATLHDVTRDVQDALVETKVLA